MRLSRSWGTLLCCVVDMRNTVLMEGMKGVEGSIKEVVDVEEIQGVWSKETESLFGVLCG